MPVNPGFTELGRDAAVRSSTVVGESFSRLGQINTALTLVSGTTQITAMYLPANATIGHLETCSASTSAGTPTHWWFSLLDSSLVQLATTADQTSTAWSLNTYQSLAVATIASGASSTFTTTYSGLHYFGVTVAATTPNNLMGVSQTGIGIINRAPVLCGASDTAQTTPPAFPHTATAITAGTIPYYAAAAA